MLRCGAIILAAGGSTRLGRPKQLLPLPDGSATLLENIAATALRSQARPVVVVLGADADECERRIAGLGVRAVRNSRWREGVASSIRAGIEAIPETAVDAAVILLCDQPLLPPQLIDRLIEAPSPIAASAYGGTLGAPVRFARKYFGELCALHGDNGARKLLSRHANEVTAIPFPGGLIDVDTPHDVQFLHATPPPQPTASG